MIVSHAVIGEFSFLFRLPSLPVRHVALDFGVVKVFSKGVSWRHLLTRVTLECVLHQQDLVPGLDVNVAARCCERVVGRRVLEVAQNLARHRAQC